MARAKKANGGSVETKTVSEKPAVKKAAKSKNVSPSAPAPALILIEGRTPRTLNFQLDHDHYCKDLGVCRCTTMKVGTVKTSKVDGSESPVFKNKRVSSSIDVRYKRRVQIEESALKVPAIAAALARRKIRVIR